MLRYKLKKRGIFVPAVWVFTATLILSVIFLRPNIIAVLGIPFGSTAAALTYFSLRRYTYSLTVLQRELILQRGIMFTTMHRIPLRYITAVGTLQSPLQRLTATTSMYICTSGNILIILGLSTADSENLRMTILNGRDV
ncbi:MAG: PH domain-containing protein [Oscillospiraceae bacterium]|nr:PH domain-containing protein [Oscillospiraceae bacterium]